MLKPRRALAILAGALLLGLTACRVATEAPADSTHPHPSGQPATVVTQLLSFEPKDLTVPAGTTVTWQVKDTIAHTVTTGTFTLAGNGLRGSQQPDGLIDMPLNRDHTVTFTFDKPGTYTYFCSIHKGMTGTVTVTS